MHSSMFALEFGIAESDNVTRADLVVLLDRGVGQVGVDEGAVCTGTDWFECIIEGFEEIKDEGVGAAITDDVVLLCRCGF